MTISGQVTKIVAGDCFFYTYRSSPRRKLHHAEWAAPFSYTVCGRFIHVPGSWITQDELNTVPSEEWCEKCIKVIESW